MERVYIRDYRMEDEPFLASMLQDPEMMMYIGEGKTRDDKGVHRFMRKILDTYDQNPSLGLKIIIRKEDEVKIGHAGIVPQTIEGTEEWEIGYWIARPYWGKGYATEVAQSLKLYGFRHLKAKKLISLIQPENMASRRIAEKNGMMVERLIQLSGKEVLVYAVLRE
ncbi:acetyltransferase [Pontibacillus chungwhensis BH030062]|uniref:Acetyltransferase n=1 Tax=Pontibacillus chungwhensis BH030062 TaxID=1385513 RepID=A0A0A2UU37_9BACI|nr:GNAT family N-acetyltransferase [Pontibacillus chungwhensis]KGP91797.1 acetyltransferase [Pontibacillus chungwhensis BH030062]